MNVRCRGGGSCRGLQSTFGVHSTFPSVPSYVFTLSRGKYRASILSGLSHRTIRLLRRLQCHDTACYHSVVGRGELGSTGDVFGHVIWFGCWLVVDSFGPLSQTGVPARQSSFSLDSGGLFATGINRVLPYC